MTMQTNEMDFHAWNVDVQGNIRDQCVGKYYDDVSTFWFSHCDYTLVYKKWKAVPEYIRYKLEHDAEQVKRLSREVKITLLKTKMPERCCMYTLLKHDLFKWDYQIGSLGLQCQHSGRIVWEFGNGQDYSDF